MNEIKNKKTYKLMLNLWTRPQHPQGYPPVAYDSVFIPLPLFSSIFWACALSNCENERYTNAKKSKKSLVIKGQERAFIIPSFLPYKPSAVTYKLSCTYWIFSGAKA